MAVIWNVVSLDAMKTVGSLSDVVTTIHWTASGSETVSGVVHSGHRYGSVGLAEADSKSFTAYADITKDNAVAWVKAALGSEGVTGVETGIAAQITESKTPTASYGTPW
jgi:hypothetical protein